MNKRILSLLLVIVILVGLLPMTVLTVGALETPEAAWGASADSLSESGTLAEAIAASAADNSIKYIQLASNVETEEEFYISAGEVTIDLNGYTVTGTGASNAKPAAFSIATDANTYKNALNITFTDSSEDGDGAVVSQNGAAVKVNAYALGEGVEVVLEKGNYNGDTFGLVVNTKNSEVTVQDGVFISATNTFGSAVSINGGVLTMNGGTLNGKKADFDFGARTATDATLDFSGYAAPDGLTILATRAMPVAQVELPEGYGLFNAQNVQYAADETVARNDVVTIKSTIASYTVTYAPGTDGIGMETTDTKTEGEVLTLKGAIFNRTGHKQTGWATTDGGEKAYDLRGSYTNDAEITLYPVWTAETYKINYLGLEDGVINGTYPTTYTYGVGATLPKDVTRDGFTFKGWSLDAVTYSPVGSIGTGASGDKFYYAHWEADKVQLTATQTVTEANWYPGMSISAALYLEDFFTVTKEDGTAFTGFDMVVTDGQGAAVEKLENAGIYTVTLTLPNYYKDDYTFSEDTFTFTVKPLDLASTRVGTFTALSPTYTGQTALPTATTSGKLNFRVYIYNVFVGSEKMYSVDYNDGLWEFAAIDGKNSVEAGDAWANVVSKSSNIIGTYEYKYTIRQAEMEVPEGLTAVNETIDGKNDGKIISLTTAMEYSTSKYGTYTPVTDVNMLFEDDTYYVRTAAPSANYEASDPVEITIAAGRKLTVTVPAEQQNYTLTASKTELSWHGSTTITFAFAAGYGAGEDFAVMVNNEPVTLTNNKFTIRDVEEDLIVTVTGVKANQYTVTFDTNGGAAIDPITVTYGEKYGTLPSSAITGLSGGDKNWYLVDGDGNVTDTNIKNLSKVETARDHTLFMKRSVLAPTLKITLEVPGAISDGYQYYIPGNSTRILTATVNNENKDVLDYTYQWYKDGVAIDGATDAMLMLDGNVSDSGTYKVNVTAKLKAGSTIAVTADTASAEKEQSVKIIHAANTLSYDANGGENAPGSHYTGGTSITVASDEPCREHYTFLGWNTKADGSGSSYSGDETFTFAEDNGNGGCEVTLYAQWKADVYAVTLVTNGGTIKEGDMTEYTYGVGAKLPTKVTRSGYSFRGWYDNEDCKGEPVTEITTNDHGDKTFYAKWKKISSGSSRPTYRPEIDDDCHRGRDCPMYGYADLDLSAWYHDGVHFCLENSLMNGISGDQFAPNGITTRAMIVTILWRLEGSPNMRDAQWFEDVPVGQWYSDAIAWSAFKGIVDGYGNGKFGANDAITREQMVTIMYRYAKYKGCDVSIGENTNILSYDDAFDVADWAIPAMQWACGSGMLQGIADGSEMNLVPQGNANRAQAAAILQRFCENVEKRTK